MSFDYSLWPNPDGNLGAKKVAIPDGVTVEWPDGDALVGKFVYKDGKLVGFVDNKALVTNDSKSTTFPYDYVNIELDKSLEGTMTFNKGTRTKYLTVTYATSPNDDGGTFDYVIIDFNTTDQSTIDTVRSAYRVVDKKMYAEDGSVIGTWDTSKLEVGGIYDNETDYVDGMFLGCENLASFSSDLSSLTDGTGMFGACFELTSFTTDLSSLTSGFRMFMGCTNLTSFNSDLSSLTDGGAMFAYCYQLESFNSDLSSLTDGGAMFGMCTNLTSFTTDLSSLTDGLMMFTSCTNLTSFNSDLSSLTDAWAMFGNCTNLTSFNSDLSSLTDAWAMFQECSNLTTFTSDLSSLTSGLQMFYKCPNLTSFTSDLPSLKHGNGMFDECSLDTASVQNIANTINTVPSGIIDISIGNSTPNEQEDAAFKQIQDKGWTVYVNGSNTDYVPRTDVASLDETGEETVTPIPYWAKPVPSDEEHAHYVDAQGNFFNIVGAQFIYGDDLSTYGMFTCEEDAAANMRLTKYERPEVEEINTMSNLASIVTAEEKKEKLMELFRRNKP